MDNQFLEGQITEHCEMVDKGVKPLSFMPVHERDFIDVDKMISFHNLHYSWEWLSDQWRTIYIYKHEIIGKILNDIPKKPKRPIDHAVIGFLCGYGINEICSYIEDKTNRELD